VTLDGRALIRDSSAHSNEACRERNFTLATQSAQSSEANTMQKLIWEPWVVGPNPG